jgi:hypothetical protein
MKTEGTVARRTIATDEVRLTAFHQAHPGYGTAVHLERGELSLVCWCEHSKDLRVCEIDAGQGSLPAA